MGVDLVVSGGARNRSGPQKDPKSLNSAIKGVSYTALPAQGFDGPVPDFPLPRRTVWYEYFEDRQKRREPDDGETARVAERELALWEWVWRTPQACAWAQPGEAWRLHTVAMWVRTFVICESSEATAADKGSLHRFADQIGLTPAGLKENGWAVAADEVGKKRAETGSDQQPRTSARDRLSSAEGA